MTSELLQNYIMIHRVLKAATGISLPTFQQPKSIPLINRKQQQKVYVCFWGEQSLHTLCPSTEPTALQNTFHPVEPFTRQILCYKGATFVRPQYRQTLHASTGGEMLLWREVCSLLSISTALFFSLRTQSIEDS